MRRYEKARPTLIASAALLGVVAALGGCRDAADAPAESRLAHGAPSLEELGARVWDGLTAADTAALARLRLSEHEHNELVWPEQPAAREVSARENLDYWWKNIQTRSRAALEHLVATHAGSTRELRAVECEGEARQYDSYRALSGCVLVLGPPEASLRLEAFRYVIEMDGAYKVVRYYGRE